MSSHFTFLRSRAWLGVLLLGTPLAAQAPGWEAFRANWVKSPHPPLTLLVPKAWMEARTWTFDDVLLQLLVTRDASTQILDGSAVDQLREARGWGPESHWLALDRKGDVLADTTAPPSGADLRGLLLGAGYASSWDELDRFLRMNPDQGTAQALRLHWSMNLARIRFASLARRGAAAPATWSGSGSARRLVPAGVIALSACPGWDREVSESLDRISRLPDAWRMDHDLLPRVWMDLFGPAAGPDLDPGLSALCEGLQEVWRRVPDSGSPRFQKEAVRWGIQDLWLSCSRARFGAEGRIPDLPDLTPAPGHVWPPARTIISFVSEIRIFQGPEGVIRFLNGLPSYEPRPELRPEETAERRAARAAVVFSKVVALAGLGRWPEASEVLREARSWIGRDWPDLARGIKGLVEPPDRGQKEGARPDEEVPPGFLETLALPPLPEPPPPMPSLALRFVVWGSPPWVERWPTLRNTEGLANYGPDELRRAAPTAADEACLHRSGIAMPVWAVLRGTELVAHGEGEPEPALLAARLTEVSPSRIDRLDAFIRQHPDHLDARRDRYEDLRPRMPVPALESRLQEDAATLRLPLDFSPQADWISDLEGWRFQAKKVVPDLQAALARWPDQEDLWRAWISWAAFLPKPPSVLELVQNLPVFGSRTKWAASLPAEVHRAITREGLETRRFQDLHAWFRGAWSAVRDEVHGPGDGADRAREKAILDGYRTALRAAGQAAEAEEVGEAWGRRKDKRHPPVGH